MNNKLKLSFLSCILAASGLAQAEELQTIGSISAMCSFAGDSITDGTFQPSPDLDILSSVPAADGGYIDAVAASIKVANNSPGGFAIILSTPSSFTENPPSYVGTPEFESNFVLNKDNGANNSSEAQSGQAVLSKAGSDQIWVRNIVTNNGVYIAGTYTVENTITCATQ